MCLGDIALLSAVNEKETSLFQFTSTHTQNNRCCHAPFPCSAATCSMNGGLKASSVIIRNTQHTRNIPLILKMFQILHLSFTQTQKSLMGFGKTLKHFQVTTTSVQRVLSFIKYMLLKQQCSETHREGKWSIKSTPIRNIEHIVLFFIIYLFICSRVKTRTKIFYGWRYLTHKDNQVCWWHFDLNILGRRMTLWA